LSDLWTAAGKAAADARHLAGIGSYESACNRAYFAMFNAARALLRGSNDSTVDRVRTHSSVLRLFSLKFIRNGPFDAKFGEIMRHASELRTLVDYEGEPISAADAAEIVNAMDEFLVIAASVRSTVVPP
jgi:uncharacterized protein (UPF0332 family)